MPTELGDFHQPRALFDKNGFKEKLPKAVDAVRDGLPAREACMLVFGIGKESFKKWKKWYEDDVNAGFDETESNLIKLMKELSKEDISLHRRFTKTAVRIATEEDNVNMLQFMLKTRFGYSEKNKSEVELSTDEETNFQINIVESKPRE